MNTVPRTLIVEGEGIVAVTDLAVSVGGVDGQELHGLAFRVTDLLDASGVPLTNSTLVPGIQIDGIGSGSGAAGSGLDSAVFAFVPEPSTALLVGLGLIGLGARRRNSP